MKVINLDHSTAQQELLDMPLGEVFFFNQVTRGGKLSVLGKFDEGGEFRMEGQSFIKDGVITHDEVDEECCQYWVGVAMGNEVEEEYPTPEEEYWSDFAIHARRRMNDDEEDLPFHHPDYMSNYKGGRI